MLGTPERVQRMVVETPDGLFFFFFFKLVNSLDDFCIFAPPDPGPGSVIGETEVRRIGHVSEKEYD